MNQGFQNRNNFGQSPKNQRGAQQFNPGRGNFNNSGSSGKNPNFQQKSRPPNRGARGGGN
jgi:hypothetical protein